MFVVRFTTLALALFLVAELLACPMCEAPGPTLSEDIAGARAVVIAKLLGKPPESTADE